MIVLVAEDDPDLRELLVEVLAVGGHTAHAAADGRAALALLRARGADAVLTDLLMPELGGLDLAAAIRADPATAALPIVLYSASADEPPGRGVVFDRFVRKPFSLAQILAAVEAVR